MAGTGMHPYHHHPWAPPPAPAPPPASAVAPPPPPTHPHPPPIPLDSPSGRSLSDEVRTVFISGLPEDVKERELQNLLRWLPGYEASQVNFKGEHPMGFALFATGQHALAAKETLQDMVFDSDSKSVLHTEMAKKNLFVKRGIVADSNAYDQSKRMRTGGDYTHTAHTAHTAYSASPFHPPPQAIWAPHGYMPLLLPLMIHTWVMQFPPFKCLLRLLYLHQAVMYPSRIPKTTLLVTPFSLAILGENINEEELRGLFTAQPGFKQMKVLRQERHTVCFIEFEDVNSATNVHRNLQGAVIPSSGSVGMRIQYSKNPFGRRKDSINSAGSLGLNGIPPSMTYN